MSGLVLLFRGRPLKPAPKISGENRRRFYFEPICGRERSNAERESPAEILSELSESKDLFPAQFVSDPLTAPEFPCMHSARLFSAAWVKAHPRCGWSFLLFQAALCVPCPSRNLRKRE